MAAVLTRPGTPVTETIIGNLELLATDNHGVNYQVRDVRTFTTVGRIVRDCVDNVWVAFDIHGQRVVQEATMRDAAVQFDRHISARPATTRPEEAP